MPRPPSDESSNDSEYEYYDEEDDKDKTPERVVTKSTFSRKTYQTLKGHQAGMMLSKSRDPNKLGIDFLPLNTVDVSVVIDHNIA